MRITANQHFTEFKVQVFPEHKPGPFATIEMHTTAIDYATIYLDSEAEADQLIKAGCAAKDMLHAAKHATAMAAPPAQWLEEQPPAGDAPAPLASLRDRDHYTAPDVANDDAEPPLSCWAPTEGPHGSTYICTESRGHAGDHVAEGDDREV